MQASFDHLARFMSGWFHQDFDIVGPTWQDVVEAYRQASTAEERLALQADIDAFLDAHPGDDAAVDAHFQARFEPEVIVGSFMPTTRAFLQSVRDRISG